MEAAPQAALSSRRRAPAAARARWTAGAVGILIAWAAVMLAVAGKPAVRRTQEARVLESAREMLGRPLHDWLIPSLDGQLRLQKPPLAYWLSAAGYGTFGVSEWAGRVAPVLSGLLTLAVTFLTAARLFGRRAGFFATTGLAGSLMFCHSFALAETDAGATLFVTISISLLWRAAGNEGRARSRVARFHLASLAIGLAALCKGPPALFPIVFLLALAAVERRPRLLWEWLRSGAPLTAAVAAGSWFLYVALSPESRVIRKELRDVMGGTDHPGWFIQYFPQLLYGVVPWCLPAAWAVGEAIVRFRRDARLRGLLLWCAAIFVPLCLAGNKQPHYLLPLLPPVMILNGWLLDRAWRPAPAGLARRAGICVGWTLLAAPAAATLLLVVVPWLRFHRLRLLDVAASAVAAVAALAIVLLLRRQGRFLAAATTFAAACAVAAPFLVVFWPSTLYVSDSRQIAASLRSRFGAGPYCFLGEGAYLPLCFAMRAEIPYVKTASELLARGDEDPGLVVLVQADPKARGGKPVPPLPPGFEKVCSVGDEEERMDVYRLPDGGVDAAAVRGPRR
jgi:4-amino-4-deoxy-L-arabinose transferase-like glycosyltransferase